jgi:hypothetical protein
VFQTRETPANRGLRHFQFHRGAIEAAAPDHFQKNSEIVPIDSLDVFHEFGMRQFVHGTPRKG